MLLLLLFLLAVLLFGGYSFRASYGYAGYSPALILLLILVFLLLTGHL